MGSRLGENEFRRLYETMAQGAVYQDSSGSIIKINPAAVEILGISEEEALGRTSSAPEWQSIKEDGSVFPHEEHAFMRALRTGKKVRNVVMGIWNPTKEERVWILVNADPEFKEGESKPYRVFTTFTDISEQKKIEAGLNERNRMLETLMEVSSLFINLPISKLDDALNDALARLGALVHADRMYIFEHDYTRSQIQKDGQEYPLTSNTHEWCADGIESQMMHLQNIPMSLFPDWYMFHQKGMIFEVEDVSELSVIDNTRLALEPQGIKSLITIPIMGADGSLGFVGIDSVVQKKKYSELERKLLRVFAELVSSVKQRVAREKEARDKELFFRSLIEESPLIILVRNLDTTYRLVNKKWEQITGLSRSQALGVRDEDLFPKEHIQHIVDNDLKVIREGKTMEFEENIHTEEESRYFWSVKFPIRLSSGEISGVCSMVHEVTEQAQTLRRLEHKNQALRQIAFKQSHELRGPLTRLVSLVTMMDNPNIIDEIEDWKTEILKAANEMDSVIREIADQSFSE